MSHPFGVLRSVSATRIAKILEVAGDHHGLIDSTRLAALGVTPKAAWRLGSVGVLLPTEWRGIRRVAGCPVTHQQRLLGAAWAAGPDAVISHCGASWLWTLDGVPQPTLEVSAPRGSGRRPKGVTLHHSTDLDPAFVTTIDGIPVTDPTRSLVDLAAEVDTATLEIAFDSALRQGLTSVRRAEAVLRRMARPGRDGVGRFRALLDTRATIDGVTDSMFETRLIQVLRRAGLPEPDRQIELYDEDAFIGRFDCGYQPARIVIEADSVRHHHSRSRFEADRARRTRAEAIGWRVPTFTWRQVTRRPLWVAERTAAILDATGWPWRSASETAHLRHA
jgi:very-short-patch-repair endonuclease